MAFFEIGKIVNTQGLNGEVKVYPLTDEPGRFKLLKEVELSFPETSSLKQMTLKIEKTRLHKQFVLIKFLDFDTIDRALTLKGAMIKIPEALALPLKQDEYYLRDLIEISVVTDENEHLGNIDDIIKTGANDVYSVKHSDGSTLLIPAIKQCILSVDVKNRIMVVKLLEGLRS